MIWMQNYLGMMGTSQTERVVNRAENIKINRKSRAAIRACTLTTHQTHEPYSLALLNVMSANPIGVRQSRQDRGECSLILARPANSR